jgi:hypothetical protein
MGRTPYNKMPADGIPLFLKRGPTRPLNRAALRLAYGRIEANGGA